MEEVQGWSAQDLTDWAAYLHLVAEDIHEAHVRAQEAARQRIPDGMDLIASHEAIEDEDADEEEDEEDAWP